MLLRISCRTLKVLIEDGFERLQLIALLLLVVHGGALRRERWKERAKRGCGTTADKEAATQLDR